MTVGHSRHCFPSALRLVCLSIVVGLSGCQFAPSAPKLRWPWAKEKPIPHPERVVAVWTDTVLHQPNQPGVRGFGGRVYLYEADKTDPIEVDGGLAVYVFDADKLQANDQRPLRKFVFTPEQFASQMSRTSLGPSYSVWLPWGEVGGPPLSLSLIARYEGSAGGTTIGEPTIKMLPGVPVRSVDSEKELADKNKQSPYQLVGHIDSEQGENGTAAVQSLNAAKRPRHDVKTIDLPPSFQRHLQRGDGASDSLPAAPAASSDGQTAVEKPVNDGSGDLVTLDNGSLQRLTESQSAAPMATTIIDHRTRNQQRFGANGAKSADAGGSASASRLDIREGRWLESKPRIGRTQ